MKNAPTYTDVRRLTGRLIGRTVDEQDEVLLEALTQMYQRGQRTPTRRQDNSYMGQIKPKG
jgi:hypothetical protein